MGITIAVEINPINAKWCGTKCKHQLTKWGQRFYCRLFGEYHQELLFDEENCVCRHPDCIKAEQEAKS